MTILHYSINDLLEARVKLQLKEKILMEEK